MRNRGRRVSCASGGQPSGPAPPPLLSASAIICLTCPGSSPDRRPAPFEDPGPTGELRLGADHGQSPWPKSPYRTCVQAGLRPWPTSPWTCVRRAKDALRRPRPAPPDLTPSTPLVHVQAAQRRHRSYPGLRTCLGPRPSAVPGLVEPFSYPNNKAYHQPRLSTTVATR